jgi:dienelactone hydrolase
MKTLSFQQGTGRCSGARPAGPAAHPKISRLSLLLALAVLGLSAQAQSVLQFSATTYTVAENAGIVTLTVQRTNDVDTVVSVDFATNDGTATNGLKYTAVSGTLAFGAGETNQDIVVPILNEALVEGIQTFTVSLGHPTGGAVLGTRTNATVRITDNDTGLQFEPNVYSVAEDAGSVLIGVVRGDDGNFPVTVDCATSDVTATNGVDYVGVTNTLSFAAGEKVKRFAVPIFNDSLKEANKTFRLTLSNPTGGGVLGARKTATVTIVDNDPGVQFELRQYCIREDAGALTVRVLRGNDVDHPPFTVEFATADLTATAGQDYTETKGTLVFAAGEDVKTVTVPIRSDDVVETNGVFQLILTNASAGVTVGPKASARVTIVDTTGLVPHRFDGLTVLPDRSLELTLGGGVLPRFQSYFDLYPLEVSKNLVDWTPWMTLVATNGSNEVVTCSDPEAATQGQRFYRTAARELISPFGRPPGPFPVGVSSRLVTDPARGTRYSGVVGCSFMVSIWYPAIPEAGRLPAQVEESALALDAGVKGWYGGPEGMTDRRPYFVSHALPNAPCAEAQAPYPVVAYSPGGWGLRAELAERGPYLASHGYVVVTADPIDTCGTPFPDGSYWHGDSSLCPTDTGFQDRVKDLRFLINLLAEWDASDPVFVGKIDTDNVATMGFSFGAGVAGEVARTDARCRAVVILEGYFQNAGDLLAYGMQQPCLSIYRGGSSDSRLFSKLTYDAIWFQIRAANVHDQFSDYYWLAAPNDLSGGREIARIISDYTLWFLNKYLKGSVDPMPALTDYPRIMNFKQK